VLCEDSGVDFVGSVDISKMPKLFQSHDVVVLPSYREGYPKVLMEGAACGCALVATDLAGCRGIIVENGNGYLVPVKSVDALVESCSKLLDRELLTEFQSFSSTFALANFSDDVLAKKIDDFYSDLLVE
jgi:glycosyltransferase involved in cell wall biosynthesis